MRNWAGEGEMAQKCGGSWRGSGGRGRLLGAEFRSGAWKIRGSKIDRSNRGREAVRELVRGKPLIRRPNAPVYPLPHHRLRTTRRGPRRWGPQRRRTTPVWSRPPMPARPLTGPLTEPRPGRRPDQRPDCRPRRPLPRPHSTQTPPVANSSDVCVSTPGNLCLPKYPGGPWLLYGNEVPAQHGR